MSTKERKSYNRLSDEPDKSDPLQRKTSQPVVDGLKLLLNASSQNPISLDNVTGEGGRKKGGYVATRIRHLLGDGSIRTFTDPDNYKSGLYCLTEDPKVLKQARQIITIANRERMDRRLENIVTIACNLFYLPIPERYQPKEGN